MKYAARMMIVVSSIAALQACDNGDRATAPHTTAAEQNGAQDTPEGTNVGGATLLRVVKVAGDVDPKIAIFADSVGLPDNGSAPGYHATGRRTVNWDGVQAPFLNNDNFPPDFFNTNATRGLVYRIAPGTGLRVSDNDFSDINPTYGTDLEPFSLPKMFAPIGTNIADIEFRIPGTNTPAAVARFGAVLDDPDLANTTRVICYDKYGTVIANVSSPVRRDPDEYSLVGVIFSAPVITRVRLILGNTPMGANINDISSGGTKDVGALDDLIYSEPQLIH